MPTYNRRAFVPNAIDYFLRQDYPSKELIILDDGSDAVEDLVPKHPAIRYYRLPRKLTLGAKLNMACGYAEGDIIVNWDDDDWYAPWRLTYQREAMAEGIAVCGLNKLLYLDLATGGGYQYRYPEDQKVWLLGSSLCFTKAAWRRTPFADINVGMDGIFVWGMRPEEVRVLEEQRFAVHLIHKNNISPKKTSGSYWAPHPVQDLRSIMGADWHRYVNDGSVAAPHQERAAVPELVDGSYRRMRNVYACLVHEAPDCIADLVANLRYNDPESAIVLYNGSMQSTLLDAWRGQERLGVYVHPRPKPQEHGYLHGFALDCMQFAAENLSFDLLTIVDSDQLCLRSGYVDFLSRALAGAPMTGMLSSNAALVLPGDSSNPIAAQALDEWALWQPIAEAFTGDGAPAVSWTFWPGTVFCHDACLDLLKLFSSNLQLKTAMKQTRIWATEEVIFPTLIRFLGYTITDNPASGQYVRYRQEYTPRDLRKALLEETAFWMHPVPRVFTHPLRDAVRERSNRYAKAALPESPPPASFDIPALLARVRSIKGWLSDAEAKSLIDAVTERCATCDPCNVVETGSYHGKATVLLGTVLQRNAGQWSLAAIDPHDGLLGAADIGLVSYPPSYNDFCRNLAAANLTASVDVFRCKAVEVPWSKPIHLLLLDGLHDYQNVYGEFAHFEPCLAQGSLIALHDYADYFPGVKRLVGELIGSGRYHERSRIDTLIILERL